MDPMHLIWSSIASNVPLVASTFSFAFALLIWLSATERTQARPTVALSLGFGLWSCSVGAKTDPEFTTLHPMLAEVLSLPVLLLPGLSLWVALTLANVAGRVASIAHGATALASFVFVLLQAGGLVFSGFNQYPGGRFAAAGPAFPAFIAFAVICIFAGCASNWIALRESKDPIVVARAKYWLIGAGLFVPIASVNFFVSYGFPILPMASLGQIAFFAVLIVGAYRGKLFGIDRAVLSLLGASILAGTACFFVLAALVRVYQDGPDLSALCTTLLFTVAAGLAFRSSDRMRGNLDRALDAYLFPERRARIGALWGFNQQVPRCRSLAQIQDEATRLLSQHFGSQAAAVLPVSLPSLLGGCEPAGTSEESRSYEKLESPELGDDKNLRLHPAPLAVPFGVDGSVQGRIVVGPRVSGVAYDEADRALLGVVASQVGLALDNLALREQLATQQGELDEFRRQAADEVEAVRAEIRVNPRFARIIGESIPLIRALQEVERAAECDLPVLVYGETGTGKELIARSIHDLSPRRNHELECVNCPAIPLELAESELFGFERGAFTGAQDGRAGSFERADQGTLFLDEVADLPLGVQTKLLRVLQEHESRRLGSQRARSLDFRLVAATNRDLRVEVAEGRFREDLMHRLMGFQIVVPPLRDRRDDIPMLASYFIARACESSHKSVEGLSTDALEVLVHYPWPGNVRELKHVIERAVLVCPKRIIHAVHIGPLGELQRPEIELSGSLTNNLRDAKIRCVEETLELTNGNQAAAARILGMSRSNLSRLMKRHGIKAKRKRASRNDAATGSAD